MAWVVPSSTSVASARRRERSELTLVRLPLQRPSSQGHGPLWYAECNVTKVIVEPGYQTLRHHGADLLVREIDDRHHQPSDQFVGLVQRGDLGAGFPPTQLLAEVDLQ